MKRPVWRCVNRLDHGKTLCKHSPTLDEKPLQEAVLAAVNILMSRKDELSNGVVSEMIQEMAPVPGESLSLADIERAIADLARRFDQLMDETDGEESIQRNLNQFRERVNWRVDCILTHCAPTSIQQKLDRNYTPDRLTDFL